MKPSRLRDSQRALSARILSHYQPEVANLAGLLRRPPRGDQELRLELYGGGYTARIEEALLEIFPVLAHLLGRGAFSALAKRYAGACGARFSYNLNDAGALFPDFVADDEVSRQLPFAADLALLECKVARAFDAEQEAAFDPAAVAAWSGEDWQRACLRFQPSLAVVRSAWPILTLWELRDVPIGEIDVEVEGRPESVVVFRSGFRVCVERIQDAQALAIAALARGRRLDDVADDLADKGFAPDAAFSWLSRLQPHGVVTGVELQPIAA